MSKRTVKKSSKGATKRRGSVLSALGLTAGLLGGLFVWNKRSGRKQQSETATTTPSATDTPKPTPAPRVPGQV